MTDIIENYDLKSLNSFGLNVKARGFIAVTDIESLQVVLKNHPSEVFLILGEGSNILFKDDYKGIVLHPDIKGIEILHDDEIEIHLKVGCGENWDKFVEYCVAQGWGGIENLSLIPGSVGSAPVQNIGAYGVEVKDRILWVEGLDLKDNELKTLNSRECQFDYRQSIFKTTLKGQMIISSVAFRLDKHPRFELGYGHLANLFNSEKELTLASMRETIIEIRQSKLPDPAKFGNAGSFFKNPIVSLEKFQKIQDHYLEVPSFPTPAGIKIPAAWLIEKAGWKGVREGDVGTWPNQPLVIVNYGSASGQEIFKFSEKIQEAVRNMFEIELEREVNVV